MDMAGSTGNRRPHRVLDVGSWSDATQEKAAQEAAESGHRTRAYWWETLDRDHAGRVIFVRDRKKGLGDIVTILPAVQTLRRLAPRTHISMQIHAGFHSLVVGHPDVDEVLTLDVPTPDGRVIDLTSPCAEYESSRLSAGLSLTDSRNVIFARASGLPVTKELPRLYPAKRDVRRMSQLMSERLSGSRGVVGLVVRSAERWKDYPWTNHLAALLVKRGYAVCGLDLTREIPVDGVLPLTGLTLGELMASLLFLDVLVTPDTGTLHMAEALCVSAVALFGSMSGALKADAYVGSQTRVVQRSNCPVQPCFYARCRGVNRYQPCMTQISPQAVLRKVREIIDG